MTKIKTSGQKLERALAPKSGTSRPDDMDILDKLKKEHEEASELLKKLVDSDRAVERKALLRKLKAALVPHLRAEEKVVYDAILALKDKDIKIDGEEGYLEHALGDKVLGNLGKIQNAMSPEFSAAAKVLKELVEHHVEEEERNVWSDVRKNFSAEDRIVMNRKFEAAKKKVKV
ncbi:MAG TPA: hemerythrin domain-containing protein [Rhizomicrobium sp.]|nr:hemerythrin domain-containing protein [Rhizomicrobium sp.]